MNVCGRFRSQFFRLCVGIRLGLRKTTKIISQDMKFKPGTFWQRVRNITSLVKQ
jgi:hypothetical protein